MKKIINKLFKSKKILVLIVLLLIGLGWFLKSKNASDKKVDSVKIEKGTVREELVLSGQIEAGEHAKLSFQGSGELAYIGVKEGDVVKKNQILARLDTTSLYQAVQSADADLRYYQSVLDRVRDQLKGHEKDESFTQIETRTAAEAAKDKAYRAHQVALKNLTNSSLKAPFDGIVTAISFPFTGVNTIFSQPQIEIVNPGTINFEISADQNEVIQVFTGQKVIIVLDSYPNDEYGGVVRYVGITPKQGETGAVYNVKVVFNDPNIDINKVRIGMTGDAKLVISEKDSVLYVPPKYVKSDTGGKYLKIGGANNKTYVQIGIEGEDRVEIISDQVKEGDMVFN